MYMYVYTYTCIKNEQLNSSTYPRPMIHMVGCVLIQDVLCRDDGDECGVSTLNDFGVVQSYVFYEVSIHV